jgi:hypothetical protein
MASTWGASTWSSNSWNDVNNNISVTGIGASASLGNETIQADANVIPTGIAITASQGEESIVIATTGDPTGIPITTNLGTADAGPDAMATGIGFNANIGTVDAFNLNGWARQQCSTFAWGITGSLLTTGEAATANLGSIASITGDANVIPTGIAMTASQGDESIEISFEIIPTAIAMSANLGTADAGPDAMLQGIGFSANLGTLEAYNLEGWGRYFWGQFEWDATGEWESVTPTGISMSANVGTLAITGTSELTLTGIGMTAAEGTVDPSPDAIVTGIGFGMAVATGTVVSGSADVTVVGEGFSAALGTGTLDAVTFADVTSISMSANLGSVTTVANANVTPTGIQLTMTLNSANALIWNEVNTGSAPIDPPGWQEVPTRAA